jgi:hypothetical protein
MKKSSHPDAAADKKLFKGMLKKALKGPKAKAALKPLKGNIKKMK